MHARVQAVLKRSGHSSISIFIINQHFFELPKRTYRSDGKMYHIINLNYLRDVQNLYQDKGSMDMTLNEYILSNSACWNEKYQTLFFVVTKEKFTGRHRLKLNCLFVPNTNPF